MTGGFSRVMARVTIVVGRRRLGGAGAAGRPTARPGHPAIGPRRRVGAAAGPDRAAPRSRCRPPAGTWTIRAVVRHQGAVPRPPALHHPPGPARSGWRGHPRPGHRAPLRAHGRRRLGHARRAPRRAGPSDWDEYIDGKLAAWRAIADTHVEALPVIRYLVALDGCPPTAAGRLPPRARRLPVGQRARDPRRRSGTSSTGSSPASATLARTSATTTPTPAPCRPTSSPATSTPSSPASGSAPASTRRR